MPRGRSWSRRDRPSSGTSAPSSMSIWAIARSGCPCSKGSCRSCAPAASPKLLRAGERAEVELTSFDLPTAFAPAPPAIVALPAQAPGAWREGRLVYDNVRLADLVADLNRYYAPGVHLDPGAIGDMRIMASFRTNEIPAFMSALGATLPVRATEYADGAFRVAATAN